MEEEADCEAAGLSRYKGSVVGSLLPRHMLPLRDTNSEANFGKARKKNTDKPLE